MSPPAPAVAEREVRMRWGPKQYAALTDTTHALNVEGSLRSGKTTMALWKELSALVDHPGLFTILSRWTEDATHALLKPLWRAVLRNAGVSAVWNGEEHYDELPNGSRAYIRGLKAQDAHTRYGKFRGLTLSRAYVDQAEEMPHDVYLELKARLSQKGYPHQITITPQAVEVTHWIAHEFPESNAIPDRRYLWLSVYDNAPNLDADTIRHLEATYPLGHPKRKTLVDGRRGLNVIGVPVYKGMFNRALHERPLAWNPALPLYEAYDFGKHHPCWLAAQFPIGGGIVLLGGVLGMDLFLEDFLPLVQGYRAAWFPKLIDLRTCCDPAGTHAHSHGTRENALSVLRAAYAEGHLIEYRENSNAPDVRGAMVERLAGQMRRRTPWGEAFGIDGTKDHDEQMTRWWRVGAGGPVPWAFLADGCEAGYVWDEHYVSVGSKQVRKPKKDGWYEHGQNCLEYLELNFGGGQATAAEEDARDRARRAAEEAARQRGPQSPEVGTGWMG
jgi:hypothetical protein